MVGMTIAGHAPMLGTGRARYIGQVADIGHPCGPRVTWDVP